MSVDRREKHVKVRVRHNQIVYTHPGHPDLLRAPDAEALAPNGIETASACAHKEGEVLTVPPHVADELVAAGSVERVQVATYATHHDLATYIEPNEAVG